MLSECIFQCLERYSENFGEAFQVFRLDNFSERDGGQVHWVLLGRRRLQRRRLHRDLVLLRFVRNYELGRYNSTTNVNFFFFFASKSCSDTEGNFCKVKRCRSVCTFSKQSTSADIISIQLIRDFLREVDYDQGEGDAGKS